MMLPRLKQQKSVIFSVSLSDGMMVLRFVALSDFTPKLHLWVELVTPGRFSKSSCTAS